MSTRSITKFIDENGNLIVSMYKHHDGYPDDYGLSLAEYLNTFNICNGVPINSDKDNYANGLSCLAAQVISHYKKGVGEIYLLPSDSDYSVSYVYSVRLNKEDKLEVEVRDYMNTIIFNGDIADFKDFCISAE